MRKQLEKSKEATERKKIVNKNLFPRPIVSFFRKQKWKDIVRKTQLLDEEKGRDKFGNYLRAVKKEQKK